MKTLSRRTRSAARAVVYALATTVAVLMAVPLHATFAAPPSAPANEWLVLVDHSRHFRSPCLGARISAQQILTANHCLSDNYAFVRSTRLQQVRAEVVFADDAKDLALLRTRELKPVSRYAPAPSAWHPSDDLTSILWLPKRDGTFAKAVMVEGNEDRIAVTAAGLSLCFGDSGTPLLRKSLLGEVTLVGLLSSGDFRCARGGLNRFGRMPGALTGTHRRPAP